MPVAETRAGLRAPPAPGCPSCAPRSAGCARRGRAHATATTTGAAGAAVGGPDVHHPGRRHGRHRHPARRDDRGRRRAGAARRSRSGCAACRPAARRSPPSRPGPGGGQPARRRGAPRSAAATRCSTRLDWPAHRDSDCVDVARRRRAPVAATAHCPRELTLHVGHRGGARCAPSVARRRTGPPAAGHPLPLRVGDRAVLRDPGRHEVLAGRRGPRSWTRPTRRGRRDGGPRRSRRRCRSRPADAARRYPARRHRGAGGLAGRPPPAGTVARPARRLGARRRRPGRRGRARRGPAARRGGRRGRRRCDRAEAVGARARRSRSRVGEAARAHGHLAPGRGPAAGTARHGPGDPTAARRHAAMRCRSSRVRP